MLTVSLIKTSRNTSGKLCVRELILTNWHQVRVNEKNVSRQKIILEPGLKKGEAFLNIERCTSERLKVNLPKTINFIK